MADELIVTLNFEIPPHADELGELLAALGRDYRDMTKGRVLVATRLESGSTIIWLKDLALDALPYIKNAVEVVKGAKAIADFAKLLSSWFNRVKSGEAKKRLYRRGRKPPALRSIEAMLKITASTGGSISIRHTDSKGATLEVKMTSAQAIRAREDALIEQRSHEETEASKRIHTPEKISPAIQGAIGRLLGPDAARLSFDEAQSISESLISILEGASLGHLIDQIATDFENRGLLSLASALRSHEQARGNKEPPLSST